VPAPSVCSFVRPSARPHTPIRRYESQLAVAEKQYLLLQRQYDAGLASNDVAAEAAATLRRERDALWAETQNLKAEVGREGRTSKARDAEEGGPALVVKGMRS
jgi:hypothetical protein